MRLDELLLYRGDATPVDKFTMGKTSDRNLFGPGIYLTDDAEIASDYTLTKSPHVVFSDPEAKTQRQLLAGYLRQLIDKILNWDNLKRELEQQWADKNIPGYTRGMGLSNSQSNSRAHFIKTRHEELSRVNFNRAEAMFRDQMSKLRVRVARNTMGELSIVTRERPIPIAVFDIPESYLARVLHAEQPLPDKVLMVIRKLWLTQMKDYAKHGLRDDNENEVTFDDYIKNYKKRGTRYAWSDPARYIGGRGENPSLDDLRNGTNGGYHVFQDGLFDPKDGNGVGPRHTAFVKAMRKLGYVGLEYLGGMRVGAYNRGGGGRAHRAFVFWNDDEIANFRQPDRSHEMDFEHDPKAALRHSFKRVYKRPEF